METKLTPKQTTRTVRILAAPVNFCLCLENLISDLLDDAGNRLKKSKLSSMRQIKQTLRFGRRSDPLMAPTFSTGEPNDQQVGRWSDLYED